MYFASSSENLIKAVFNTLSIHSNIGSAIITTEYSKRHIKYYGNLIKPLYVLYLLSKQMMRNE